MSTSLEQRSEANSGLSTGQAAIQFKDEGSNLGTSGTVTAVNFTGAGVTASRATNTVTVNVPVSGEVITVDVCSWGTHKPVAVRVLNADDLKISDLYRTKAAWLAAVAEVDDVSAVWDP